ncbi:MAG TPA: DNA cytosine methyltransferase [Ktedonosporobacter sp.]|nr:DNA cytosine methyltransferase [Ktedonosporobacter sp.]
MEKLRLLSLCSGIGGADLSAEWTGEIEVVGQVEIDPFCQSVLAKHWPDVKRMSDIREVNGDEFGAIDLLAAGIPCQGNSLAGKRQGAADERNLWPETRRIIGAARPRWVVVENVVGLLSVDDGQLFATILSDLDQMGYRAGWMVYGASEVGAPHQRERVFLVAHLSGIGSRAWRPESAGLVRETDIDSNGTSDVVHSDSDRQWIGQGQQERQSRSVGPTDAGHDGTKGSLAYTSSSGWQERDAAPVSTGPGHAAWRKIAPGSQVADTQHRGCEWRSEHTDQSGATVLRSGATARAEPQSSMGGNTDGLSDRVDGCWPAGPDTAQEAWEPPRTITGRTLPNRTNRLKALGNAIVPQQIYPIFECIVAIERRNDASYTERTVNRS